MLLVLTVERGALLQWQFGIGVYRHPGWPNTHLKPFEHSVLFLAAPLMPLQVLEAARALVLDSDGCVAAAPGFGTPDPAT